MKSPKVTKQAKSPHGRWYEDACGTAFGLELLGERWSLLIVRELMFGPRRFTDLRASLPGISAKVLTERLTGLEATRVIQKETAPEPAPAQLYGLTAWGYAAEPILQEMGRWAASSHLHDPTLPLSPVSFMLSLRTMLDRPSAVGQDVRAVFAIGTARFTAHLSAGEMPVERGEVDAPDLIFRANVAPALAAVFYGNANPNTVGVEVIGSQQVWQRFVDTFKLPEKLN